MQSLIKFSLKKESRHYLSPSGVQGAKGLSFSKKKQEKNLDYFEIT